MSSPLVSLGIVMAGGALGAGARWLLSEWSQRVFESKLPGEHFPIGTLIVNVLGCLAIGALAAWLTTSSNASGAERIGRFALPTTERHHLWLFVGVLGGFTTFSSFAIDALALIETGARARALAYVLLSNVLGITGAAAAYVAVERVTRT